MSRHTTRLAQKTASLKILYDVAASVNQAQNSCCCAVPARTQGDGQRPGGHGAAEQPDGTMRVVGLIGISNEVLREREMPPLAPVCAARRCRPVMSCATTWRDIASSSCGG